MRSWPRRTIRRHKTTDKRAMTGNRIEPNRSPGACYDQRRREPIRPICVAVAFLAGRRAGLNNKLGAT